MKVARAVATAPGGAAEPVADPLDASRLTHLVGYAASRAAITMRRVFVRHLGPLDLKVVDYSILAQVASNPQINQKRLGEALDISPPNMAVTIARCTHLLSQSAAVACSSTVS